MCTNNDKSHVEAWKSLIELIKTLLSIDSAILAAMAGYYVLSDDPLQPTLTNYLSPGLLIASMLLATYGFGRAIKAIKDGSSEKWGIGLTNLSILFLVLGIACIVLIEREKPDTLATALERAEKEAAGLNLSRASLQSIGLVNGHYVIRYRDAAGTTTLSYSPRERRLVQLDKHQP